MVTFYLSSTTQAQSLHTTTLTSNECLLDTTPSGTATNLPESLAGGASSTAFVFTSTAESATWVAASSTNKYYCYLTVATIGADISYGLRTAGTAAGHFGRISSAMDTHRSTGGQIEALFTGTGVKVASTDVWDPSAASTSDRFECVIAATRPASHGNQTIELSASVTNADATNGGIAIRAEALGTQAPAEVAPSTGTSNAPGLAVQAATTYDKVVVGDTPVSFWNDDSGTDAIGLSNLTKVNSPTSTQAPDGSDCMVFNGTNQYAEGTDQNAHSIPTTGRLTFEAWIRPDVLEFPVDESTGYVNWAGKTGAGATNDAEWLTRMYSKTTTDNPPRPHRISGYAFNPDGGLGTGGYFQDPFILGEWIHVVFVVNKADADGTYPDGYGKLYKNGILRRQENLDVGGTSINPGNGTAPFRIGSARAQSSFFKGAIAKPAIYSYELTAAQVLEHYNAMQLTSALSQDPTTLVDPGPQSASGSASANNATVTTTGGGEASAQNVLVTVTVETSSRLVSASAKTA